MEHLTPSKTNPIYSAAVISRKTGKRYAIQSINYPESKFVTDLSLAEKDKQLAQSAQIKMMNAKTDDGYFSGIIDVLDRVFIYANDGEMSDEVFRGFVWERPYSSKVEKEITLTCYDNLIYMMKSEISEYFSAGKSTQAILNTLCQKWGVSLDFKYKSINHPKLPLSGNLADVILSDVLDEVKKQTGTKYVVRSIQDKVTVSAVGSNDTVYEIKRADGAAISTHSTVSMDNVVTKVVITGSTDDNDKTAIEAVVTGDTAKYGTLQQIQSKSKDTTLAEAKAEANTTLKENGSPKRTYEVSAIDIPWVHKGDKVKVVAGDMSQMYIVLSVTHNVTEKTMDLEVELP
jgi:hypothetical protein